MQPIPAPPAHTTMLSPVCRTPLPTLLAGEVCALELHVVTAVDNTTDVKVPQTCNEKLCLAVFGIKQEVRGWRRL